MLNAVAPVPAARRRARLPIAMGAMLAALVGVLMFPFLADEHRSPLWPVLAVAAVALGGAAGGALYHVARRLPSPRIARAVGALAYLAVTCVVFDAVLDGLR